MVVAAAMTGEIGITESRNAGDLESDSELASLMADATLVSGMVERVIRVHWVVVLLFFSPTCFFCSRNLRVGV